MGGAGQIGRAVARELVAEGWDVAPTSRHPADVPEGCRHLEVDGRDADRLRRAAGENTDFLLSCAAFDARDGAYLARAATGIGRIVAISSASVFRDAEGRTLDEAAEGGFPDFPVPLVESSPTLEPGPETYSTRKIAMEQALRELAPCPVTILRPCAIHGPESRHAREWWVVKRLLDGRETLPLAYGGRSQLQTTSTASIGRAVTEALRGGLPEIANVTDSDSPNVIEICRAIMDILGRRAKLVALPDAASYPPDLGATPWSIPKPMICAAAVQTGQAYASSVGPAVAWLANHVRPDDWRDSLPQLAAYAMDLFDDREDDWALRMPGAFEIAE